ncbi:unnamed protein product [Rotaria magnacalcarata]|uniref:Thioredoxin domain-containing protein n=4 Tax=Rotaria magnacalcarata TaxID=392030 RepID=A0A816LWD7_9BILA|nr:unnamed protein product [Rotaria magnacalcarata]CAF1421325.1 unnamed protein product [Rotaria magnacalcarata]CAF1960172.1 unnamed protein product [Rotaria magnacalcarata]CAF2131846.1 unnamed protein product [Rotaria magnacalcarata]CAF3796282.1 unnamed protein product [Rotaria magnacalcarata]
MSMIANLLSFRTSTYLTRNIIRSTSLLTQNRFLSSTLPPSNKADNKNSTLPNELPLSEKKKARFNISWKTVSVTLFGAASLMGFIYYLDQRKVKSRKKLQRAAVGKMAIGGPFSLITHEKKPITDKDFHGQWLLIYFGFTHCPDICPEELEKLAEVTEILRKQKSKHKHSFQPIFVSVDPERDTPELVSQYIKDYSPHFIGLTGTRDQVAEMCKHYRVYFSQGPKVGDDYIVDHAIIMYLINPNGDFVDYYGRNKNAKEVSSAIEQHMNAFKETNK